MKRDIDSADHENYRSMDRAVADQKSSHIVWKKVLREFEATIEMFQIKDNTLTYDEFGELLMQMGYLDRQALDTHLLLDRVWKFLTICEKLPFHDVLVFLAAIQSTEMPDSFAKYYSGKRETQQPLPLQNQQNQSHISNDTKSTHAANNTPYYTRDANAFISMSSAQRKQTKKKFIALASNKRTNKENQVQQKKVHEAKQDLLNKTRTKPKISQNSLRISMTNERLSKPIYNSLIDKGDIDQERKTIAKKAKEQAEMEDCTFKPYVSPKSKNLAIRNRPQKAGVTARLTQKEFLPIRRTSEQKQANRPPVTKKKAIDSRRSPRSRIPRQDRLLEKKSPRRQRLARQKSPPSQKIAKPLETTDHVPAPKKKVSRQHKRS